MSDHVDLPEERSRGVDGYVDVTYDILREKASSWRARRDGIARRRNDDQVDSPMYHYRSGEIDVFDECIRDLERVLDNTPTARAYVKRAMGSGG